MSFNNKQKGMIKINLEQIINNAKLAKMDVANADRFIFAVRDAADDLIRMYIGATADAVPVGVMSDDAELEFIEPEFGTGPAEVIKGGKK